MPPHRISTFLEIYILKSSFSRIMRQNNALISGPVYGHAPPEPVYHASPKPAPVLHHRVVGTEGASQDFGRDVNPIQISEMRLHQPHYNSPPGFSNPPTSLHHKPLYQIPRLPPPPVHHFNI